MGKIASGIFALSVTIGMASAAPDMFTAGTLYEFCSAKDGTISSVACDAYVRGLADSMMMAGGVVLGKKRYCPPPEGVQVDKAVGIIWQYLHDHPRDLGQQASTLAEFALTLAYPCH